MYRYPALTASHSETEETAILQPTPTVLTTTTWTFSTEIMIPSAVSPVIQTFLKGLGLFLPQVVERN
jgi:hypothetical protein